MPEALHQRQRRGKSHSSPAQRAGLARGCCEMTRFVSLAQLGEASFVGRLCETPQCVEDATTEPCISQQALAIRKNPPACRAGIASFQAAEFNAWFTQPVGLGYGIAAPLALVPGMACLVPEGRSPDHASCNTATERAGRRMTSRSPSMRKSVNGAGVTAFGASKVLCVSIAGPVRTRPATLPNAPPVNRALVSANSVG